MSTSRLNRRGSGIVGIANTSLGTHSESTTLIIHEASTGAWLFNDLTSWKHACGPSGNSVDSFIGINSIIMHCLPKIPSTIATTDIIMPRQVSQALKSITYSCLKSVHLNKAWCPAFGSLNPARAIIRRQFNSVSLRTGQKALMQSCASAPLRAGCSQGCLS